MGESTWNDPFFAAARTIGDRTIDVGIPGGIRLVAVDLDGVVWLGGSVLPDAPAALTEVVSTTRSYTDRSAMSIW